MSLERFTRKPVVAVQRDSTIRQVAELMGARHVGAAVVVEHGQPVGIVTDRDLTVRALARGLPASTPVAAVMSGELVLAHVDHRIDEALFAMRESGVRRLPIVDHAGHVVGMVSLDDLLVLLTGELSTGVDAVLDNRGP